jgi:hypothetical protein
VSSCRYDIAFRSTVASLGGICHVSNLFAVTFESQADFRVRPRAPPSSQLTDRAQPLLPKSLLDEAPTGPVDWKGDPMVINPGKFLPRIEPVKALVRALMSSLIVLGFVNAGDKMPFDFS